MKKLLFILTFIFISFNGFSQAFTKGSSVVSIGYGFPNLYKTYFKIWQSFGGFNVNGIGPAFVKYEYFASNIISVGVSAGFVNSKLSYDINYANNLGQQIKGTEGLKTISVGALAKVNAYWLRNDKLMMYSGLGAGYNYLNFTYYSDNPSFTEANALSFNLPPIGFELTAVGAKYMFSENIGGYAEMGYGKSILQAGICIGFGTKSN